MPFLIVESYISLNLVGSFAVVTSVVGGSVVRSSAVRGSLVRSSAVRALQSGALWSGVLQSELHIFAPECTNLLYLQKP